jgi:pimeloyl-ACP methyl ester carboxylesterase
MKTAVKSIITACTLVLSTWAGVPGDAQTTRVNADVSAKLPAATQDNDVPGVTNIVLVHGAFINASSWSKVIPLLEAKGLHAVAAQIPLTSFADDVAATKRAIALQEGPVLLVGHSYAGAVITEAGNDPKVAGLLFVAAFAPAEGESVGDIAKSYPAAPGSTEVRPDEFGYLTLTAQGMDEDIAEDLSPSERKVLTATQGPTAAADFGAKVVNAAWKSKPSWYVVAGNDRMVSPKLQQETADRMKAKSITIPSSHIVMLSHPRELASFIEEAAKTVTVK